MMFFDIYDTHVAQRSNDTIDVHHSHSKKTADVMLRQGQVEARCGDQLLRLEALVKLSTMAAIRPRASRHESAASRRSARC